MFSLPAAHALCARAIRDGGLTFRVSDGTYPASGWAVSVAGRERKLRKGEALSPHHIADYMADHGDAFDCREACLGVWHDHVTDTWYLDTSAVVGTRAEALRLGKLHLQLAVFDLGTGLAESVEYGLNVALDNAVYVDTVAS